MPEAQTPPSRGATLFACAQIALGTIITLGGAIILLEIVSLRHVTHGMALVYRRQETSIALLCFLVIPSGMGLFAAGIWRLKQCKNNS